MSSNTKSILLLVVTLLLGIVIGVLLMGPLFRSRYHELGRMMHPERFGHMLVESIQPVDDDQLDRILELLDRRGEQLQEMIGRHRRDMAEALDSMLEELRPLLEDEQWERIQRRIGHLKRLHERGKRPPPGVPYGHPPGR